MRACAEPGDLPAVVYLRTERHGRSLHPADLWPLVVRYILVAMPSYDHDLGAMIFSTCSCIRKAGIKLHLCSQVAIFCEHRRPCVSLPLAWMPSRPSLRCVCTPCTRQEFENSLTFVA